MLYYEPKKDNRILRLLKTVLNGIYNPFGQIWSSLRVQKGMLAYFTRRILPLRAIWHYSITCYWFLKSIVFVILWRTDAFFPLITNLLKNLAYVCNLIVKYRFATSKQSLLRFGKRQSNLDDSSMTQAIISFLHIPCSELILDCEFSTFIMNSFSHLFTISYTPLLANSNPPLFFLAVNLKPASSK